MQLHELVPDVEVLAAMPAEELAAYVLRTLPLDRHHGVSDVVLPQNLTGYAHDKIPTCQQAVAEAWQSLLNQGLVAPSPQITQSQMYVVSRKGRTALTAQEYADNPAGGAFPPRNAAPRYRSFNL